MDRSFVLFNHYSTSIYRRNLVINPDFGIYREVPAPQCRDLCQKPSSYFKPSSILLGKISSCSSIMKKARVLAKKSSNLKKAVIAIKSSCISITRAENLSD